MDNGPGICVVVLAGNVKISRELARRRRRGLLYRLGHPSLWAAEREKIESRIASQINKDDYIVGENKSLLYLHPDLCSQGNINFLKRTLYFAGKTGDRLYRKRKQVLLEYLSVAGETSLSLVIKGVMASDLVDPTKVFVVGPRKQITNELERCCLPGPNVVDQGGSIGENILRGKEAAISAGYLGRHILIVGGDSPLITPEAIRHFLEACKVRGLAHSIYFGVASREGLKEYIERNDLVDLGRVGPNRPGKGNLNKFGLAIMDDGGNILGKGGKGHIMVGNMLLCRTDAVKKALMDRFYSLRKMGASPFTYPSLIRHFGRPILRSMRWKLALSEVEAIVSRFSGIRICLVGVPPEMALDIDSYTDMRRASVIMYRRLRPVSDLERDLILYAAAKRKERRLRRQHKKSSS
ncbi:MAG: NTP transferase domain-containing protein [Candidatus Thermoplasmatota archaeon]|jgi:CTP:molybdopterin cytidylyltransferase MocA|nr:NTP transferase domain-containing protein [Candidatus Thermoplasmatota archaeon]